MAIQGLGEYGGFYNQYKTNDIPKVDYQKVSKPEQTLQEQTLQEQISQDNDQEIPSIPTRSKSADLENISLTFNQEDSFDYIGTDREIGNLDVQKAVSDMQKDSILSEYQYFVGNLNNNTNLGSSLDGTVLAKTGL
ncbi:MAG: hypothetical protein RRX92_04685 [Lachnospiraceae bacterium]